MEDKDKNYFTTGQMRNALLQIEDQMVHSNWMPNMIIGINRGGLIPSVYLSHRLRIPHETISVKLRDQTKTSKPDLSALEKAFAFQNKILIVDDINDSGDTLKYIEDNFGRPNGKAQVTDHVLKDFSEEEKQELQDIVNCIINSITILIDKKLDLFSSTVNNR